MTDEKFQTVKVSLDCGGNAVKEVQLALYKVTSEWMTNNKDAEHFGRMIFCTEDNQIYICKYNGTTYYWLPLLEYTYLADGSISVEGNGEGNGVTSLGISFDTGKAKITYNKDKTFLTEHQKVVNKEAEIPRTSTLTTIATIGSTDITVKEAPISISNKSATLEWNANKVIATIEGTNITAKLPANPNTINVFNSKAIIGPADTSVETLITTYQSDILACIGNGVSHFDLIKTHTDPRFATIGLGQADLLSLMGSMFERITIYCLSIGAKEISREIVFHFQMYIPSVVNTDDDFIHIPIAVYDETNKTFSALGVIYDTQLIGYFTLSHTTSGLLFYDIDVQIRFNFGTIINGGATYCSMTPVITLI